MVMKAMKCPFSLLFTIKIVSLILDENVVYFICTLIGFAFQLVLMSSFKSYKPS